MRQFSMGKYFSVSFKCGDIFWVLQSSFYNKNKNHFMQIGSCSNNMLWDLCCTESGSQMMVYMRSVECVFLMQIPGLHHQDWFSSSGLDLELFILTSTPVNSEVNGIRPHYEKYWYNDEEWPWCFNTRSASVCNLFNFSLLQIS